jgi:peptidoglycan/xylan/chitin deacetylase (PgdA/CDA1 family)
MARLPILMYHNVSDDESNSYNLTISISKLEQQLEFLSHNNFTSFFVSELENNSAIPTKSIVITFDDVTENQLRYALPLLKKFNLKATFFVPFSYLGKTDLWNSAADATDEKIMTIDQLKSLDANIIELGHHSFLHQKYTALSEAQIQLDFDQSFQFIADHNLSVYPALAYPYGNYPKKGIQSEHFFQLLKRNNIKMAFRIGNRVNSFPFKNKYEIQRIDIKGQDSFFTFKCKLRWGKLRLF